MRTYAHALEGFDQPIADSVAGVLDGDGKDLAIALREFKRVCKSGGLIVAGLSGPPDEFAYKPVLEALDQFMPKAASGGKPHLSMPTINEMICQLKGESDNQTPNHNKARRYKCKKNRSPEASRQRHR